MAKQVYYGRRIVKVRKQGKIIYVLSGQWVGHKSYGSEYGTKEQHRRLLKACGGEKVIAVSTTIFWKIKGYSGDIIDKKSDLVKRTKF